MNLRYPFLPFLAAILSAVVMQMVQAEPQAPKPPALLFDIKIDDGQIIKGYFVSANAQDVIINNGTAAVTLPRARLTFDERALFAQAAVALAQDNKMLASDICRQILIFNPRNSEASQLLATMTTSAAATGVPETGEQPKAQVEKMETIAYQVGAYGQRSTIKINGPLIRTIKTLNTIFEQKFGETVPRGEPTEEIIVFDALGRALSLKNSRISETYEYDQNGRLKQMTRSYHGNSKSIPDVYRPGKTMISYDSAGRKNQEDQYDPSGTLSKRVIFTYDADGLLTARESYDTDRKLKEKHIMVYDGSGRILEKTRYSADGKTLGCTVHVYSAEGHTETDYSDLGIINAISTYDVDGNRVNFERFKDGMPYLRIVSEFLADGLVKSGNIINLATSGENKGNITSERPYECEYAFDQYKNWVERERYSHVDRFGKKQKQLLGKTTRIIERQ